MSHALSQHPAMSSAALGMEVHYFDADYGRGLDWYRSHFPRPAHARSAAQAVGTQPVAFESSPYYMFHPLAAERIFRDLPGAKLLVLLRDPVERAYSAHAHEVAWGFETEPFEQALSLEADRLAGEVERILADPGYVSFSHRHHAYRARGQYAEQLERLEKSSAASGCRSLTASPSSPTPSPYTTACWSSSGSRTAAILFSGAATPGRERPLPRPSGPRSRSITAPTMSGSQDGSATSQAGASPELAAGSDSQQSPAGSSWFAEIRPWAAFPRSAARSATRASPDLTTRDFQWPWTALLGGTPAPGPRAGTAASRTAGTALREGACHGWTSQPATCTPSTCPGLETCSGRETCGTGEPRDSHRAPTPSDCRDHPGYARVAPTCLHRPFHEAAARARARRADCLAARGHRGGPDIPQHRVMTSQTVRSGTPGWPVTPAFRSGGSVRELR